MQEMIAVFGKHRRMVAAVDAVDDVDAVDAVDAVDDVDDVDDVDAVDAVDVVAAAAPAAAEEANTTADFCRRPSLVHRKWKRAFETSTGRQRVAMRTQALDGTLTQGEAYQKEEIRRNAGGEKMERRCWSEMNE
jgi:hypothetical protein